MRINDVREIAAIRMKPGEALKNPRIRYQHYIKCGFDYPEEFIIGFDGLTLVFSDRFPCSKIAEYEKLFKDYAKGRTLDSKRQAARMKTISKRFGKQGELTALKMFNCCHSGRQAGKERTETEPGGRNHDRIQFLSI